MKTLTTLALITMPLILASCSILPHNDIPAVVDCEEKRIAVVPFAVNTGTDKIEHYSSETGNRYARIVGQLVRERSQAKLISSEKMRRDVTKFSVRKPDWAKICRQHKLDHIIVCTITKFSMSDPRNHSFIRGLADVHVTVINSDDEIMFDKTLANIRYPKPISSDPDFDIPGGHALRTNPQQVRTGLDREIIQQVAWLFYDHQEPKK